MGSPARGIEILSDNGGYHALEAPNFFPAEGMSWTDGFAMVEDRGIVLKEGMSGILSILSRSLYAYLSSTAAKSDAGLLELSRFTREERFSENDPYNGQYQYYYASALGEHYGLNNLDRITALSKALKHIQERAALMDDAQERQMYLRDNYWNRQILENARASKLF